MEFVCAGIAGLAAVAAGYAAYRGVTGFYRWRLQQAVDRARRHPAGEQLKAVVRYWNEIGS